MKIFEIVKRLITFNFDKSKLPEQNLNKFLMNRLSLRESLWFHFF